MSKGTCTDNLLRLLWTSCSELSEGLYGIQITKTNTNNCNCCTPCQQWECTATLILDSGSSFGCADVANCINTNTATQTAINNLINARINFPSTNGNYILTITWGVATRSPYTPSGSGSNVPNKPTTPWVYELTIDGSGNATRTIATSGGSWSCLDTENCIRNNAWVQDAIKDLIFGNWNTTLCAAITAAWCSGSSSFPFSSAKSTSFNFSWSWTTNWNTNQVQNVTSTSPISWLHIKWHIGANNNDWSSVWYAWWNVDLYYDATTNILYWTATSMYWWVWPYAAWNEYAVWWVNNAIWFTWWSYTFNTYVESSISVTENTASDFNVNFWAYHYGWADWYSFTWIIQVY